MTPQVVRRPRAEADLDEQAAYLQQDSPHAAIRFLEEADAAFDRLAEMPLMGKPYLSDNPRLRDVRTFRIAGFQHIVYYRPIEGGIEVLRVLHGARDIPRILAEEQGE